MTPEQIKDTIRNQVYESTAAFYTDAEIYSYMWQAEQEIAQAIPCTETRDTTSLTSVTSTEYYDLPSSVAYVHRVEWNSKKLKRIDFRDRDTLDYSGYGSSLSEGQPYAYYQWGTQIGLYPVPEDAKNITLYYYKTPTAITTSTTAFTVPDMFTQYIPDYALYRMYAKDQDDGRAQFHRQQWEANIVRAKQKWGQRQTSDYLYVVKDSDMYPETEVGMT